MLHEVCTKLSVNWVAQRSRSSRSCSRRRWSSSSPASHMVLTCYPTSLRIPNILAACCVCSCSRRSSDTVLICSSHASGQHEPSLLPEGKTAPCGSAAGMTELRHEACAQRAKRMSPYVEPEIAATCYVDPAALWANSESVISCLP